MSDWIEVGPGLAFRNLPIFAENPAVQQAAANYAAEKAQAKANAERDAAIRRQRAAFANAQRFQQQAVASVNAARRSLQILGSNQANVTATARQTKRKPGRASRARTGASLRIGGTATSSGSGLNIAG